MVLMSMIGDDFLLLISNHRAEQRGILKHADWIVFLGRRIEQIIPKERGVATLYLEYDSLILEKQLSGPFSLYLHQRELNFSHLG
jgi:hypothetical protein